MNEQDVLKTLSDIVTNKQYWIGGVMRERGYGGMEFSGKITDVLWEKEGFFVVKAEWCRPVGVQVGFCSVQVLDDCVFVSGYYGPHFTISPAKS